MATSKERLLLHLLHSHHLDEDDDNLLLSKTDLVWHHRDSWPKCEWSPNRPKTDTHMNRVARVLRRGRKA